LNLLLVMLSTLWLYRALEFVIPIFYGRENLASPRFRKQLEAACSSHVGHVP